MNKPRLLFDVDGPLTEGFVNFVCDRLTAYGVPAQPDLVRHWDPMDSFPTPDEVRARVNADLLGAGVARQFAPRLEAVELLRWCRRHSDVYAVTTPWGSQHWMPERHAWLIEHFEFNYKHINHIHDKFIVHGDVLVDDKLANVRDWQVHHPEGLAVLWRTGHNRDDAWHTEVSTCAELLALLQQRWKVQ